MKQLLIISLVCIHCTLVNAQDSLRVFKPFKVDISTGFALPQGSGTKVGALFALEPKYAIVDQFALGLRLEIAAMERLDYKDQSTLDLRANASAVLTGDYYFNNNNFRPLLGAGFGFYQAASVSDSVDNSTVTYGGKFGFMIRGGFEWGHFRMGVEYNFLSNESQIKNSYLGIKIGAVVGGGRRKK